MSSQTGRTSCEDSSLSLARQVDRVCREFEKAWLAGQQPRLEEVLAGLPETHRGTYLRELLPVEIELRQAAGDPGSAAAYQQRFPEHVELITEVYGEAAREAGGTARPVWPELPGYRILAELGRGGMGIVYQAEDSALGRLVAIKVLSLRVPLDSRHQRRFEREAKAAGRLHHTNIVPVFGIGAYQGQHFYVMQFIPGQSLDRVIEQLRQLRSAPGPAPAHLEEPAAGLVRSLLGNGCSPSPAGPAVPDEDVSKTLIDDSAPFDGPEGGPRAAPVCPRPHLPSTDWLVDGGEGTPPCKKRRTYWHRIARVGLQVASALEYAHGQGVLHRDIKPSNLLLDPQGTVWVTDFGLAKADDQSDLTRTGDVLGTLRYVAPEAFEGRAGTRSDVYSLGLTLYEAAALRPAFDAVDRNQLVKQVTTGAPRGLGKLCPDLPRDLATIIHKAIEREPDLRYASAGELAADLQHFLNDEPIRARRRSAGEQLVRWCRQNRMVATLMAAVFLSLLAGAMVATWFAIEARTRAECEQAATTAARQAETTALETKRQSDLLAARLRFKEALRRAEAGDVDVGLRGLIEALRLAPNDPEAADFRRAVCLNFAAWSRQAPRLRYIVRLGDGKGRDPWIRPIGPDGRTFAVWAPGQPLQVRETLTGRPTDWAWSLSEDESPLALSPDGTWLLTRIGHSRTDRWSIQVRHLPAGEPVGQVCPVPKLHPQCSCPGVQSYLLSPRWVMTGGLDMAPWSGPRRFWNLEEGKQYPLLTPYPDTVGYRLIPTREGKPIAVTFRHADDRTGDTDGRVEFWDVETGQPVPLPLRLASGGDPHAHWDGNTIISVLGDESEKHSFDDGSVRWWSTATGRMRERWQPRRKAIQSILLPSSQTLAAYGRDERIRLYDLDTGWQRGGDLAVPTNPWFLDNPAGAYPSEPVLLTHAGGLLHAWDTIQMQWQATASADPRRRPPSSHQLGLRPRTAAVAPSGKLALLSGDDLSDYGRLVDVATGQPTGVPFRLDHLHHIAFRADERLVAVAPHDFWSGKTRPEVQICDTATGKLHVPPLVMPTYIHDLAFAPDGRTLAVARIGGTALVDAASGKVRHFLPEKSCAASLAFSPDGSVLAVGCRSGWGTVGAGVRLWDVATGQPRGEFWPLSHQPLPPRLWFIEGGHTLLAFDPGQGLYGHDPGTGQRRKFDVPPRQLGHLAARPRDALVAISSASGTVEQWDLAAGTRVGAPMVQPYPVAALEYSPDGRTLAVVCKDHAIRLWDATTGLPFGPPLVHAAEILTARFTADGRRLATVTSAGEVRQWLLPEPFPDEPEELDLWLQAAIGRRAAGEESELLDPDTWRDRCRTLRQLWPEAAADLARQRETDPEAYSAWHEVRARDAEATGNTFALLWHLERLARLRPEDWRVHARRGDALLCTDDTAGAAAAFDDSAKRAEPAALAEWYAHRLALARSQSRWAIALRYADRLVEATPKDWQAYAQRAEVHRALKNQADLQADLARARALGGDAAYLSRVANEEPPRK